MTLPWHFSGASPTLPRRQCRLVPGWHFYSILAKLVTAQRPKLLTVTVSNPLAIAVVPHPPGTTKGCCSSELAAPGCEPATCQTFPAKAERAQQNLYRSTVCFTPRTSLRFTAEQLGWVLFFKNSLKNVSAQNTIHSSHSYDSGEHLRRNIKLFAILSG